MERHRIGIIIPALNEAATIAAVVTKVKQFGVPFVIDDGSTDETGALAQAAGAVVIRHDTPCGYDAAINTGFASAEKAGCQYLITMDADGQHEPETIDLFLEQLHNGADVVVGIRNRRQRMAEYVFSWVALAKWGIHDPLCGMKAYCVEVYKALGHFDSYGSIGTELALYAAKKDKKIAQISIYIRPRADEPRFGRRWSANRKILRALWLGLQHKYNVIK